MTTTHPSTEMTTTEHPAQQIAQAQVPQAPMSDATSFEVAQRQAKALASSDLVPQQFRNNVANTLLALDLAHRTGSSPLAVMQSLYVVQGKPTWSAQFIIAALNACGRFEGGLRFAVTGEGDKRACTAWTIDAATGDRLDGPEVSIEMAKAEGWHGKAGSKWRTMPDLMLRYRAATFFGRLYAPDLLLGMQTVDEARDITVDATTGEVQSVRGGRVDGLKARLRGNTPGGEA